MAAAVVEHDHVPRCDELLRYFLRDEDIDRKGHARLHISRIKDRRRKNELVATLACLRGTRFVVTWLTGYRDAKARERVRGRVLWELLPYLATKEGATQILIELREDQTLQAADARTIGRLCERGTIPVGVSIKQAAASTSPGLWLADATAGAWRRHLAEGKYNWSRWYEPHTTLLEVPYKT
jgi:hypothetical protein